LLDRKKRGVKLTENSEISVSMNNPLTTEEDNLTILKIKLKDNQLNQMKKRRLSTTTGITVTGFFSFWSKKHKVEEEKINLEIVSNLEQGEVLKELTRAFKILKIDWNQTNDVTVRCIFNDFPSNTEEEIDSTVAIVFDVCMISIKPSGFILKFSQIKGSASDCRAVFDFMKKELKLTQNKVNE
jgi:hypothetical protein